jgi:hypothetical protein
MQTYYELFFHQISLRKEKKNPKHQTLISLSWKLRNPIPHQLQHAFPLSHPQINLFQPLF